MPLSSSSVLDKSSVSSFHFSNDTKDPAVSWHLAETTYFFDPPGSMFLGKENQRIISVFLPYWENLKWLVLYVARKTLHSLHFAGFFMGPFEFGIKKTLTGIG